MSNALYTHDQDLANLGNVLIKQYYPGLAYLKIAYMFREVPKYAGGEVVAAKSFKCDTRNGFLHNTHFIIEVDRSVWLEASGAFREAMMDHALCSIGVELDQAGLPVKDKHGQIKCGLRRPGIADFPEVVQRRGAWNTELREFLHSFSQSAQKNKDKEEAVVSDDDVDEASVVDLSQTEPMLTVGVTEPEINPTEEVQLPEPTSTTTGTVEVTETEVELDEQGVPIIDEDFELVSNAFKDDEDDVYSNYDLFDDK